MSDPFVGEIRMVGFNYAPRGWAFCAGQQIGIAQNNALFALFGTTYGGNGQSTFGLPDMRGRVPTGTGQGPGTDSIVLGEVAGTPNVTLTINQLPTHNHAALFQGTSSAISGGTATVDVGTSSADPLVEPTNGGTTYLTAVSGTTGLDPVNFSGLYTNTAPASGAKASLGGVAITSGGNVTPAGTITVGATGNNLPFSITQPYLGINFIVALEGIFPPRN